MKAKDLTVTITYKVSLSDIDMDDKVYEQLTKASDRLETLGISPIISRYQEATQWLADIIHEDDAYHWEAIVEEIE